ncbi:MAG TPA: hydrogenase maturation nickel metallochaperone HypA [Thermodesulfovibrionales bacterium]|nr:hydrogenase maturation nickel metallochaperone HypA [Thermodesulfovibrionales bacterium]
MHEASIALSILDMVAERCRAEGYSAVESVRLRIGRAAGILPEALVFTFDAAKEDTPASDAKLLIDIVPLGGFCSGCESDFEVEDAYVLNCPVCGSTLFKINRGYEMEIVEIDVK